ncbi:hypothetical protein EDB19DRAFT_855903 [Suillus lakei]|nr:hypothetical protein EDB19DRAFT_855903 [Suillus lakei]
MSSLFRRAHPVHDTTECQQHPRQNSLSRHRPHVVEVVVTTGQSKRPLYVAPPPNKKNSTQGAQIPEQNQAQGQSQTSSSRPQATVPAATITAPTSTNSTPSHTTATIDNPCWWTRIMLFICCTACELYIHPSLMNSVADTSINFRFTFLDLLRLD